MVGEAVSRGAQFDQRDVQNLFHHEVSPVEDHRSGAAIRSEHLAHLIHGEDGSGERFGG
jgi:hypothetical protein